MLTGSPTDLPTPADVVVVGSGAIGLPMAQRLAAAGRKVVLVEAGQRGLDPDFRRHNAGTVAGRPYKGLVEGRYRGLGGTTRLWGGQLMRLSEGWLAPVPALDKPGWPLTAAELRHWEDEALHLLGAERAVAEAAEAWADKAEISPRIGLDLELALSTWLRQPDFSQLFAPLLDAREGPAVLLNHAVTGLVADPASGRIAGVRAKGPAGPVEIRGREVVLACGTLENIALLLRCQAQLPASPLARNRNVGRWFFDHLHGNVGTVRTRDSQIMGRLFDTHYGLAGLKVSTKLRLSDRRLAKQPMAACAVTVTGAISPGEAVREMVGLVRRLTTLRGSAGRDPFVGLGNRLKLFGPMVWNFVRHHRSGTFLTGQANLGMECEQLPCADSYVALEPGVPADQARLAVHWALDGREVEAMADLCERFSLWCQTTGYAEADCDPRILRKDPAAFDLFHDSSHQMGGARMATSAEEGVVDGQLAVFGMPGLSVAGAAVFPSGGFANPTLSAMALGLRLADRLAAETAA